MFINVATYICFLFARVRRKNRKKIEIVGHGIDTDFFKPAPFNVQPSAAGKLRIISVGRISPIKDQETLIRAIDILFNQKNIKDIEVKFFGTPLEKYERI